MKITFISDARSWKNEGIQPLASQLRRIGHRVTVLHRAEAVPAGDILFILGFFKIIPANVLSRNRANIVVHESALPKGRGWSPVTWQILEGARVIPLTLFEAVEKVDSGSIYLTDRVKLQGAELLPQIQDAVVKKMMALCAKFVSRYPAILRRAKVQKGKPTFYARRTPQDSRLNPSKTIARQFNLLRAVDNKRYPAFFTYKGETYTLKIVKQK